MSRKKKVIILKVIKTFCIQARNWPEIFSQTYARAEPKSPAWLITLHHIKRFILRVLLA